MKAKGFKTKPKPKAKVEETVTVEEKEDVDQVENPPPRILPNKMTDVCKKYRQGNCPHGRSGHRMVNGSSCLKPHPRTCFKYMKYGADQQKGCTQGLECNWFHPVICQTSLQKLRCKKEVCSLIHLYTARKAKKDNAGRFPSEHKSSQRSNGPYCLGWKFYQRPCEKGHQTDINEGEGFSPGPLKPAGTVFEGDEGPKGACDSDKIPVSAHSSQRVASGTDTFSGKSAPGPSPSSSADATTTGSPGWRESLQKICPQSIY